MSETEFKNLLPAHLSELELRLEKALARLADVNIQTSTLWNPWLCPLEALPYLAWALSVDNWNSSWDEATKRRVIADAKFIHERKGTRPAVETAIKSINADELRLVEWFESPENYAKGEFSIEVESTSQPVDIAILRQIIPQVNAAKNERSHLKKITVTTKTELMQKHATVSRQAISARSGAWLVSSLVGNAALKLICTSRQTITIRSGALPLAP